MLNNRKTILFLSHVSTLGGGAEEVLTMILKYVNMNKIYPIVCLPPGSEFATRLENMGIKAEVVPIKGLTRTLNPVKLILYAITILRLSLKLYNLINSYGVHLIHANSHHACIAGGFIAKLTGMPIVWHLHDIYPKGIVSKIIARLGSFLANKIIAVSYGVKSALVELGAPAQKIVVIHNGIDLEKFDYNSIGKGKIRDEFNIGADANLIISVGQLIHRKGYADLINAFKKVLDKLPNTFLLIVGPCFPPNDEYGYKKNLINLVKKLNIMDKVIFTGYRKDVPEIMADSNIFVLASHEEPFGLVIAEAMALSKPVVATLVGGIPEIVKDGETGFLVQAANPDMLSIRITELLVNKTLRDEMGMKGYQRVQLMFKAQNNIERVEKLLLCILRGV